MLLTGRLPVLSLLGRVLALTLGPLLGRALTLALRPLLNRALALTLGPLLDRALALALGPLLNRALALALRPLLNRTLALTLRPLLSRALALALGPLLNRALALALGPLLSRALALALGPLLNRALALALGPLPGRGLLPGLILPPRRCPRPLRRGLALRLRPGRLTARLLGRTGSGLFQPVQVQPIHIVPAGRDTAGHIRPAAQMTSSLCHSFLLFNLQRPMGRDTLTVPNSITRV